MAVKEVYEKYKHLDRLLCDLSFVVSQREQIEYDLWQAIRAECGAHNQADAGSPTVKSIVERWLKENGYDGLYTGNGECGCRLGDLIPCDSPCDQCEAGYLLPGDADAEWYIGPKV
jgi:hypothetical protein